MHRLIGLAMTVIVACAAVIAFAPRPMPAFPATAVKPDRLLINGVATVGKRIVAAGELGRILVSDDAGRDWRVANVTPQREATFTQLMFVDDLNGLAVGHDGWITRTTDGGVSWTEVRFDDERSEPLLAIAGRAGATLMVAGSFGRLLVSDDGGTHWQSRDTGLGDRHFYGIVTPREGQWVLVGERGLVAISEDNGQTWREVPPFYEGSFFGMVAMTPDRWLVFGMRGSVYRTDDAGRSWTRVPTGVQAALFGATVTRGGRIVVAGQGGVVLVSTDQGQSIQVARSGSGQSLSAVAEGPGDTLVFGGEGGVRVESVTTATHKETP